MNSTKESILRPKKRIFGGVSINHCKNTANKSAVIMPAPAVVKIPLKQNIGAPCEPLVKVGDTVCVGTKIGDTTAPVSVPVHSSVSGVVKEITEGPNAAVVIESDGLMTNETFFLPKADTAVDIIAACRESGLVGLGGAGFPAHLKLAGALKPQVDTLIINGAECEPYITGDYRTCIDNFDDVINGVYLLREKFGFKKVIIAIEGNKPLALRKLYEIASDKRDADDTVKLMRLKTRYPQGAEKTIVYTTTGRVIPFGKFPSDVGCLVMNITSVATLHKYLRTGEPLTAKNITVDGNAANMPQNVIVPVGTSVQDVIDFCGGFAEDTEKILLGGPMMGNAVVSPTAVITKQCGSILGFRAIPQLKTTPCIKCGKCASTCPMRLTPAAVESALNRNNTEQLAALNINYCMECGCCSFACPAGRPLTQSMRTAKSVLRRNNNAK